MDVTLTTYKPMVRTSKLMFYQAQKTSGLTQRNLKLASHPQTTAKASNSHPHVTSGTGAPSKEGELCCYKYGQKGHIKPQCPKLKGKQWVARVQIKDLIEEDEELSETPTNRTPNDALEESAYPQEGRRTWRIIQVMTKKINPNMNGMIKNTKWTSSTLSSKNQSLILQSELQLEPLIKQWSQFTITVPGSKTDPDHHGNVMNTRAFRMSTVVYVWTTSPVFVTMWTKRPH